MTVFLFLFFTNPYPPPHSCVNLITTVPFLQHPLGDLAFPGQSWHLSGHRQAQPCVHSTWHWYPGPPSLDPPRPAGGCVLAKASDLRLWSLNVLEEQLISFPPLNWRGCPIFQPHPHPSKGAVAPSCRQLRVNPGGVVRERGEHNRPTPEAISFRGRCQMEDFIRLFKFLKTW